MASPPQKSFSATVLSEDSLITLEDLSRICALEQQHIVEFVHEGVLTVVATGTQWRFSGSAVRRARLAARLQHDLELNLAGVALAINLMDEIQQLRRELRTRGS